MSQGAFATSDIILPAYAKTDLYSRNASTMFISVGSAPITNTATGILAALQSAAYATATPPATAPTLYCVKWDSRLNAEKDWVLLKSITFYAYDSLITGGSGSDADNIAAIETSLADPRGAWSSSRFAYGILPSFAPNLFRPSVIINKNVTIVNELEIYTGSNTPIADRTVGSALPYVLQLNTFVKGPIHNIIIQAMAGQYISNSASANKWQMYPLCAEINFGFRDTTLPPTPVRPQANQAQTSILGQTSAPIVSNLPKQSSITSDTKSGSQLQSTTSITNNTVTKSNSIINPK